MKHPEKADLQRQTVGPGEGKKTINGREGSCRGGENILKLTVAQICVQTKKHGIIHFRWVHYISKKKKKKKGCF